MSENERKELSEKLHFGLALAERRMLEEKALRNEYFYIRLNINLLSLHTNVRNYQSFRGTTICLYC